MVERLPAGAAAAILVVGCVAAGCGAGLRAPETPPAPPPTAARSAPAPRRPSPPPAPAPRETPEAPPSPAVTLAPAPAGVSAESNYPVPRIWEWTLENGIHVWFRRSEGSPGRFVLRAVADGGWSGVPGGAPAERNAGAGLARASLRAALAQIDASGSVADLGAVLGSVAEVIAGRPGAEADVSPEGLLDAALAGGPPAGRATDAVLAARFGRPSAFRVLVAGDVRPDSLAQLAARSLAGVRPTAEAGLLAGDSTRRAGRPLARALRHAGDGGGERALVAFRGPVTGPTAGRRPEQVLAGLEVLAEAIVASLGEAARTRVSWDGREATLVLEAPGQPSVVAARVLELARSLEITDAAFVRARGAAVESHLRSVRRPEGWITWLELLSPGTIDPRVAHEHATTIRGVPIERVRALAEALLDPGAAAVVEVAH